jgi:hypothetical protein
MDVGKGNNFSMKTILIITGVISLFIVFSVVLWLQVFSNSVPEGWTTYESQNIGFRLYYPENMQVVVARDIVPPSVTFLYNGPSQDENQLDLVDVIEFSVRKLPLNGQSVESFVRPGSVVEPIAIAGMAGYRYQWRDEEEEEEAHHPLPWIILLPAGNNELFEIFYFVADETNQGYQQIVEQMLESFEAT